MKKVKTKREGNQRSQGLRRIWFSVWWPILLVVVLFLVVGTALVYQAQMTLEEEALSSIVNDYLDWLNQLQSDYEQEAKENPVTAYEYAMNTLEWYVNGAVGSQDMAGAYLFDVQGNLVAEQEPALYLRHIEGDVQAYYRCADKEIEQRILERYEVWMQQMPEGGERPTLRIDEAYIRGNEFYPVRVNIYTMVEGNYRLQEEVLAEASLPAEDSIYLTGLDLLRDGDSIEDMLNKISDAKEAGNYYPTSVYAEQAEAISETRKAELLDNVFDEEWLDAELQYAEVASTFEFLGENNRSYYEIVIPIVLDDTQYYFVLLRQKQLQSTVYAYVVLGWVVGILFSVFAALIIARGFVRTMRKEQELICRQRDYTNALAHDLKTPLMAISGYTENLQANLHPEKQEHYYEAINFNIQYMSQLIMDMLSLAQLQNSEGAFSKERIDLHKLAESVASDFESGISEKKLHLKIEGRGVTEADSRLLERAFRNLVENAVKYSPAGEAICIRLADDFIQITNTGVALPEEKWNAVFQPFVKGDEARKRESGTGLGLAIVKNIADLHGFQCSLECNGQATTVTLKR
ncbi:MAG: HAMP domain-containing histidine kinase [Bacteroides sp.]|nr:HAMP domain-containing histidine kinase [Bacteroides sp.]MCM1548957.1 HAMP domain-containing histidine kinase [Clostridium sp.]